MLTSKSTKGCRLHASAPAVIRVERRSGLTVGTINPADKTGTRRDRRENGRSAPLGPAPELGHTTPKRGKIARPKDRSAKRQAARPWIVFDHTGTPIDRTRTRELARQMARPLAGYVERDA